MSKTVTTEQFIQRATKIHGTRYDYTQVVYHKRISKVTIICRYHGEFFQQAGNHLLGQGCSKCAGRRPTQSNEAFIQKARKIHGEKYDYTGTTYNDRKTKIKYKCLTHGMVYQLPYDHLKSGCGKCASKNLSIDEIIALMNDAHNFRYNYDKTSISKMTANVKATCKKHGEFHVNISLHVHNKIGCKKCHNERRPEILTLSKKEWVRRAKLIHGEKYNYSVSDYISSHKKVKIICEKHGKFLQTASAHVQGSGCPKCSLSNRSSIEANWLDYMNISDINRNVYLKLNDKGFYVDGIIGKTIYEFYGDYWHGNPNTHKPFDTNKHNKKTFKELYEATLEKEEIFRQNGFKIISMWESEWKTMIKRNQVQI